MVDALLVVTSELTQSGKLSTAMKVTVLLSLAFSTS